MTKGGCAWSGEHVWQGVYMVGGMHGGWVCVVCGGGSMRDRGPCMAGGMGGRRDGHCSGRYASYWNALLYLFFQPDFPHIDLIPV